MKLALKIIVPVVIIVLAFFGYEFLVSLKEEPQVKQPPPVVPVVDLLTVSPENHSPPVRSYGTVTSYFETALTPQVSGKITYVSPKFRVGESVSPDHLLVKIDPTDYEAALAEQKSILTVAERTFAEEEIRAAQAAGDWEASGRELSKASDFVLRKPQLSAAQADMDAAKANIAKAQADLDRTELRAPFSAIVTARSASPGNQASPQASLGNLVSTEKVEIRLPLTATEAVRVKLPTNAKLTSPLKPGHVWEAKLVRLDPTVDQKNQVIYAVAEVTDPFADEENPLPVGMFANALIDGVEIENSYRIPEAALVNDQYLWIIGEDENLKQVPAHREFGHDGDIFVTLDPSTEKPAGEIRVVTRPLSNFRDGMKVKPAQTTK
ncbi:efflux RND transporter periplasmic adaptor subunit [Luteolibacter algae]|uniref:Efflux RND transporter periplasmic adaptor subunit n=1 Tax=Luteolibacter algae TaxID=454151 RepID=A0ABW5D834_9BACT